MARVKIKFLKILALTLAGAFAGRGWADQATSVLPLSTAIEMSMHSSPKVADALVDVQVSTDRHHTTFGELGPKVNANYSDVKFDRTVSVALGPVNYVLRPQTLQEANLVVSQPLLGLFPAAERLGLERKRKEASQLNLNFAKTVTAFEVAQVYRKAQLAREMVHIAEASILATNSQAKDAQALLESGRFIRSDLLKISIAQQEARSDLAKAIAAQKKVDDRLRYTIGLSSHQTLSLEALPSMASVQSFAPPDLDLALKEATKTRLELKNASLEVQKAESMRRLARWKFIPEVDFFIGWDSYYSALPFGTPAFTRSYGLTAKWEIWDRGSRLTATRETSGMLRKSNTALQDTKDKMRLEIQAILADLEAMKEALSATQVIASQAEEAYRLDKARFANGLVTATDLLLSLAKQTKAQGSLVGSVTEMSLLILSLEQALGNTSPKTL